MRHFVVDCWNHIMDAEINPLRHIPDLHVRHMIMQVLAFMWSAVFSIAIAESIMQNINQVTFNGGKMVIIHTDVVECILSTEIKRVTQLRFL